MSAAPPGEASPIHDILIIGAGLSGLTAAYQLHRHAATPLVLDARPRPGGRALTLTLHHTPLDFGPSWVWPGQPAIASLLAHLRLPTFPQYARGDMLRQTRAGALHRDSRFKPMAGALRIENGVAAVIRALQSRLPAAALRLDTAVVAVALDPASNLVLVTARTAADPHHTCNLVRLRARTVAFAMPPRLARQLSFAPALPSPAARVLADTPTWMAAHAKFHAVYQRPFWRDAGLSGDLFSERGPLAEVHDASPPDAALADGKARFALFGFFRVDAAARRRLGPERLVRDAVAQLADVFGPDARRPVEAKLVDWSRERWTATDDDAAASWGHPDYGTPVGRLGKWHGRIAFIGSEMDAGSGGLIEGAVRQGGEFANAQLRAAGVRVDDDLRFW